MRILFWGLVSFLLSFMIHLVVWKVHIPKRQTNALLYIFFGTSMIVLPALWNTSFLISKFGLLTPMNILEVLHIFIFSTSMVFAYVITYSAIEADSPSLVMIVAIATAGPAGLDKTEFERMMNDEILIKPRIRDIVVDGMAYIDGGTYKLTPKGAFIARIFMFSRKLLKASKGG